MPPSRRSSRRGAPVPRRPAVSSTLAPLSASRYRIRRGGYSGSIGTYAPPAFKCRGSRRAAALPARPGSPPGRRGRRRRRAAPVPPGWRARRGRRSAVSRRCRPPPGRPGPASGPPAPRRGRAGRLGRVVHVGAVGRPGDRSRSASVSIGIRASGLLGPVERVADERVEVPAQRLDGEVLVEHVAGVVEVDRQRAVVVLVDEHGQGVLLVYPAGGHRAVGDAGDRLRTRPAQPGEGHVVELPGSVRRHDLAQQFAPGQALVGTQRAQGLLQVGHQLGHGARAGNRDRHRQLVGEVADRLPLRVRAPVEHRHAEHDLVGAVDPAEIDREGRRDEGERRLTGGPDPVDELPTQGEAVPGGPVVAGGPAGEQRRGDPVEAGAEVCEVALPLLGSGVLRRVARVVQVGEATAGREPGPGPRRPPRTRRRPAAAAAGRPSRR